MSKIVGISRNIKLDWLNKVADLAIELNDVKEIKIQLNDYLASYINSPTNLRKTREILMNIWVRSQKDNGALYQLAINSFSKGDLNEKMAVHWCMMLFSYTVFQDIASVIGNLNDRQYDITTNLIKSRIFDKWGERTTLYHSIDKILKTMNDIGYISRKKVGLYEVIITEIKNDITAKLITATILFLTDKLYLSLDEIRNNSIMFPFEYIANMNILNDNKIFSIDRFGGKSVISIK